MDDHDHRKNHTTGHENHGTHICHKCGWPFPNPHPSAKHRRHHKKVCGTLEGYKLTNDSNPDDGLSDEDHKDSELGNIKSNENVKHGIQRIESNKSEEDVFSDAVAEFGDTGTSPTIETVVAKGVQYSEVNAKGDVIEEPEHPVQANQLEKSQSSDSADDLKNNIQHQIDTSNFSVDKWLASSDGKETEALAVDGKEAGHFASGFTSDIKPHESMNMIPDIINVKPDTDGTDRSLMHSGQSIEGDANGYFSHLVASPSKTPKVEAKKETEALAVDGKEDGHNSPSFVSIVNPDELLNVIPDVTNAKPGIEVTDRSMLHSEESFEVLKNENGDASEYSPHLVASPGKAPSMKVSQIDSRSEQIDEFAGVTTDVSTTKTSVPIDRLVYSKETNPETDSSSNPYSGPMEVVDIEHMDTMITNNRDVSAEEVSVVYPGETFAGCNVKAEPNEKIPHALSTTTIMLKQSHSDMTIKDSSNHGPGISDGHGEEKEDYRKSLTSKEDYSSFLSSKLDEGDVCAGQQVIEEDVQQEGTVSKSTVEERFNECKSDSSECNSAIRGDRSNGSEAPLAFSSDVTSTHTEQTQIVSSVEKKESHDSNQDPSEEILPEKYKILHETGGAAIVSTANNEVDRASYAINSNEYPEKAANSTGNGLKSLEVLPDSENFPEKPAVILEAGEDGVPSLADPKFDGRSNGMSSSGLPEKDGTDNSNLAGQYIGEGVVEDHPGEDFQEVLKGVDIGCSADYSSLMKLGSQAESVDTNVKVSEAFHEDIKVDHDSVQFSSGGVENGRQSELMDSAPSTPVEANNANDLYGGFSDINSHPLQHDGEHNLKHELNASAIVERDVLVNSDSQSDHMKEKMVSPTVSAVNEQAILSAETLQVCEIRAEEANLKRTLTEESNMGYGGDKFDMESQSVQDKAANNDHKHYSEANQAMAPSTSDAIDELVILAPDALQASDTQSQKANLMKTSSEESSTKDFGDDTFEIKHLPLQDDNLNDITKYSSDLALSAGVFVDSSSQADSVEGNWGSVSDATFPSTKDTNEESASNGTDMLSMSDLGVMDRNQRANLETKVVAPEGQHSGHSDVFDAPSFMTLVEPGRENNHFTGPSEIQTVQNPTQPNSSPLDAGWFPSHTYDVKESEGRKKNEEIIAKVSNWSTGKQHTPLRSLLVEANLETKHKLSSNGHQHPETVGSKDEVYAQDSEVPDLAPLTAPEASTDLTAKDDQEKEWDTPARLPIMKKDKRKGRGTWVPLLCCTSGWQQ